MPDISTSARTAPRIEFCGVPGSGKSALCAATTSLLQRRGARVIDRDTLLSQQLRHRNRGFIANTIAAVVPGWRKALLGFSHGMEDWIRFATAHPRYAALTYTWIAASAKSDLARDTLFRAIAVTAFEFQLANESDAISCLDEGFFHRFFTLRGYGVATEQEDARRYVEVAPRPTVLIWVATQPVTCMERIRRRPEPPILMLNESRENQLRMLEDGAKLFEQLTRATKEREIPTLVIAGEQDCASAAQAIAGFVEPFL